MDNWSFKFIFKQAGQNSDFEFKPNHEHGLGLRHLIQNQDSSVADIVTIPHSSLGGDNREEG